VPWAAGGATDQVTRITAVELEKHLGQKVVVVYQPGVSGSLGTKSAWEAARDGYTWTAGAVHNLGVYRALGMLDTNLADWHLFLSVANVPLVGVNPDTPYKTIKDLLDAMKAKPGEVTVATAGVGSAGHNAMEAIARAADVKYRHVPYDGTNAAVAAIVAGKAQVTTQFAVDQAEMIRGRRIRPLAAAADKPLELEGFGTVEPVTRTLAAMKFPANYFGVFIPKGVPPQVVNTVDRVWGDHVMRSGGLKKYAASHGALFAPMSGQDAQKAALPAVQANAWLLHADGKTKHSPDTVGIPKP
jgi:tripartite-type tricarboxylate transporter receptor subunit TctC